MPFAALPPRSFAVLVLLCAFCACGQGGAPGRDGAAEPPAGDLSGGHDQRPVDSGRNPQVLADAAQGTTGQVSDSRLKDVGPASPAGGCFAQGVRPPTVSPHGFAMPDVDAERATYRRFGWTWSLSAEPNLPAQPTYTVKNPAIHDETEGDDLWSYLMAYLRSRQPGYLDRAKAWARYFKEDYRNCVGAAGETLCADISGYGADHLWGWGLIAWYQAMGDKAALDEAEKIGEVVEKLWGPNTTFSCLPKNGCTGWGLRQVGRHLLVATRLAEVTANPRWTALRDKILDILLKSKDWDAERGVFFLGVEETEDDLEPGAYAAGARITSPFELAVLTEALDHVYRTTGREDIRDRMVKIARFVDQYGLDPKYQYVGKSFGIVGGKIWHREGAKEPVTYWDPVYTTALVNILVRGYRYTCDPHFYDRAKYFFERGNKGIYGEPVRRSAPDGVVHHFVDSKLDPSTGNFYLRYNKGELQYTYLLFESPAK
jgi:hypothetical protein